MTSASTSPSRAAPGGRAGHRRADRRGRARRCAGPVDQDPDRALGAAEDAGDLGRRHLVDEAQDDGPPTVAGQPVDGAPGRGRRLVASDDASPRRRAGRARRAAASSGASGRRRQRAATLGDDVAGDLEEPDAERRGALAVGRARRAPRTAAGRRARPGTSARWRPPPRDGRAARRPRSCTPGPGTSDTGRRTGPGRPGPPPRATDRGRGGRGAVPASSGRSTFLNAGRAIALHPRPRRASARRTWRISPTRTWRSPSRRAGSATTRAPVAASTPMRADGLASPSGRSSRTVRPVVTWRAAQPAPSNRPARSASTRGSSRSRNAASSASRSIGGPPAGLAQRGHRAGELRREVGRRASRR